MMSRRSSSVSGRAIASSDGDATPAPPVSPTPPSAASWARFSKPAYSSCSGEDAAAADPDERTELTGAEKRSWTPVETVSTRSLHHRLRKRTSLRIFLIQGIWIIGFQIFIGCYRQVTGADLQILRSTDRGIIWATIVSASECQRLRRLGHRCGAVAVGHSART